MLPSILRAVVLPRVENVCYFLPLIHHWVRGSGGLATRYACIRPGPGRCPLNTLPISIYALLLKAPSRLAEIDSQQSTAIQCHDDPHGST